MDPFKQLASLLDRQMINRAGMALSGLPCELGTITASGLKLDGFKHEIQDYLVADWTYKMELPQTSRVIKTASPVNPDGTDQEGVTQYSALSRIDFAVQGADDAGTTIKVHMDLKSELKSGDRVLAIPVNGGQDIIVVCKVVSAGA